MNVVGVRSDAASRIIDSGVVAVVRLNSSSRLLELAEALTLGGVPVVEVTMTTPGALDAMAAAKAVLGDRTLLGAGTVLTPGQAVDAVAAGAEFLVSPTIDESIFGVAREAGISCVPGALSPNEIQQALSLGAELVKLFPGRVATPGYFRDILGPFPDARLMPTGNVDLVTAPEYIRAGAVAVGVGKSIVDPELVRKGDWAGITRRARALVSAVASARASSHER